MALIIDSKSGSPLSLPPLLSPRSPLSEEQIYTAQRTVDLVSQGWQPVGRTDIYDLLEVALGKDQINLL
ncbi:uncharacterized protein N7515_001241 [Penicillium bovifimosum]|uniref:Uncharacterized protein n=1 Tax=Penicillium bovifimosum TaxID=126998 RepID=A0A9W9L8I6_9EURO|nr:uncharacterized protein N7515_001241 [Penicillium bovifimosum]KAJ5142454.1 hypothetical protein N7515_001241 [Penicillium bovifimosum]